MDREQLNSLRQEIRDTQSRRQKLDLLKIAFVTTLLGFGSVKVDDIIIFYQVLYFVPLVAVFFDLLIMGEHFSIRRIGEFLRIHSPNQLEQKWQKFVQDNPDNFFKSGSRGFTLLSFIGAIALLYRAKENIMVSQRTWLNLTGIEWAWFLAVLMVFIIFIFRGGSMFNKFDKKDLVPGTNSLKTD